jgi:hypothetical protein
MAPFIVLIALFGFFYVLGSVWLHAKFDWLTSLRLALAGMFLLTASAHWGKRRRDLIAMVPPAFPRADLLVTVTGVLDCRVCGADAANGGTLRGFGSLLHAAGRFPSKRSRGSTAPQYCRTASRSLVHAGASAVRVSGCDSHCLRGRKTLTKHLALQRLTFRKAKCKRGALAFGLGEGHGRECSFSYFKALKPVPTHFRSAQPTLWSNFVFRADHDLLAFA